MKKNVRFLKKILVFTIIFILMLIFVTNFDLINHTEESEPYPKFYKRIAPSEATFVGNIANEIPHVPIKELKSIKYKNHNLNSSCAWYPTLLDVKIQTEHWQEYHNRNISLNIFGAYFDNRSTVVQAEPLVRILTMTNFVGKTYEEYPRTYCQLWYDKQAEPFVTPMIEMHKIWYYDWGHSLDSNYAHFISCPIPIEHKHRVPRTVSLVANPCDNATNSVGVIYKPLLPNEERKEFAVCLKGLHYSGVDMSFRIVEYLETLRILGAEKITMYQHDQVQPNITEVLDYYRETGYLELHNYHLLEIKKNDWFDVVHDVIAYNDCLYRNMYRYKYVALLDTDELVMPLGNFTNWSDLMRFGESVKTEPSQKFASFCFHYTYFPRNQANPLLNSGIPEYFYMLRHVERLKEHTSSDWSYKCLHSTDHVIATHNNFSIQVSNMYRSYYFEAKVAQLSHYSETDIKETFNGQVVLDLSLWRIKNEIIERSIKVFEELVFLSEEYGDGADYTSS